MFVPVALLLLALSVWLHYGAGGRFRRVLPGALRWALILGGVGFAGGFFGPIIFVPEANQGPLLGIFITGPIGFLAGLAFGAARGLWLARQSRISA